MTQQDPQDIAARAAQRDVGAFEKLYHAHLDVIYRFVYYKVSDPTIAEDLTADVFAKAWERIDRYQWRNLPIQHWLLRIARNVVIDHWRAKRRPTTSIDDLYDAADDDPSPDDAVLRDIEVESLRVALLQLPDDQRDVIILRFIEDLSHAEAAAVLGKSVVAVRQIQVRALKALQKVLSSSGALSNVEGRTGGIRAASRRVREPSEDPAN